MDAYRYIITRRAGMNVEILRSVEFGHGGWRARGEWFSMDDAEEYPTALWAVRRDCVESLANLVGGDVVSVPAHLLGITEEE